MYQYPLFCCKSRLKQTNAILEKTTKSEPRVPAGVTPESPLFAQRPSIDLEIEAINWQR